MGIFWSGLWADSRSFAPPRPAVVSMIGLEAADDEEPWRGLLLAKDECDEEACELEMSTYDLSGHIFLRRTSRMHLPENEVALSVSDSDE